MRATAAPIGDASDGRFVSTGALGTPHLPWESDTALYLQDERDHIAGDALDRALPDWETRAYVREAPGPARTFDEDDRYRVRDDRPTSLQRTRNSLEHSSSSSPRQSLEPGQTQVQTQREWAIRRAFETYDLNGDGMISYLELRTVLARQGREASEAELRQWIRARVRSGNGAVSYEDFRAAYEQRR